MAERKCKHCAMMIPEDAKICPYCRKKEGLPLFKITLCIVGVIIIIVAIGFIRIFMAMP